MARNGNRPIGPNRRIVERPLVDPPLPLIEPPSPSIPAGDSEPHPLMPRLPPKPLGMRKKRPRHPRPAAGSPHIQLLHLVPDHHHEPHNTPPTDDRHRRIRNPLTGPHHKRLRRTNGNQLLRHVPQMPIDPPTPPDLRHSRRIGGLGGTEGEGRLVGFVHGARLAIVPPDVGAVGEPPKRSSPTALEFGKSVARSTDMEFSEVVRRRRMIRHYSDKPLSPEVIERILASALRAPSAGFSQGWAFLALTDPTDRARFWRFVPTRVEQTPTMQDAPLVVVPLAHKAAYLNRYAEPDKGWEDRAEARWPAPYWHIDTGMAALLMLLTAVDEGLGACFFGIMPEHLQPFREEFAVPEEYAPIGAITVGYRAEDVPPPSPRIAQRRRPAADVIHRGQWGRHA